MVLQISKVIIILLLSNCVFTTQSPLFQRNAGEWGNYLTAEDSQDGFPARYFICGIQLKNKAWNDPSYTCDCKTRWHHGRRRHSCFTCTGAYHYQTGGITISYCSYNDWQNKKTQTFETTGDGNWQTAVMCPQNNFITQVIPKFWQYQSDYGLTGFKIKCVDLDQNSPTYLEIGGDGTYVQQGYTPPIGQFLTAIKLKTVPGQTLWGCAFKSELAPVISKINFNWLPFDSPTQIPTVISSSTTTNSGTEPATRVSTLAGKYEYEVSYNSSNTKASQFTISASVSIGGQLSPVKSQIGFSHTTYSSYTFAFGKMIKRQIDTNQQMTVVVPSCKQVVIQQILYSGKKQVPFNATLTFADRRSGQEIGSSVVSGIWQGTMVFSIRTNIQSNDIPNCGA